MKIIDLIRKLEGHPQEDEVQFAVWTPEGELVCAEMQGPATMDLMKVFAKHLPKKPKKTSPATDSAAGRALAFNALKVTPPDAPFWDNQFMFTKSVFLKESAMGTDEATFWAWASQQGKPLLRLAMSAQTTRSGR